MKLDYTQEVVESFNTYQRMLESNVLSFNNSAWDLVQPRDTDLSLIEPALRWAKKAVELEPNSNLYWNTLGVAEYRAGHWHESLEALKKSRELNHQTELLSMDGFFIAMARWQLGDKELARQWYDKSVAWMDEHDPNNLELIQFRAEAEALLEIPLAAPRPKPATPQRGEKQNPVRIEWRTSPNWLSSHKDYSTFTRTDEVEDGAHIWIEEGVGQQGDKVFAQFIELSHTTNSIMLRDPKRSLQILLTSRNAYWGLENTDSFAVSKWHFLRNGRWFVPEKPLKAPKPVAAANADSE
jgi:tetratricopeptide (TPR) repeat protein